MQTDANNQMCKYARMDKVQIAAVAFIRAAIKKTGLKASPLAEASGIVPSTLTRLLRAAKEAEQAGLGASEDLDPAKIKHTLSSRSMQKVADFAEMALPEDLQNLPDDDGDYWSGSGKARASKILIALTPEDQQRWLDFGSSLASTGRSKDGNS